MDTNGLLVGFAIVAALRELIANMSEGQIEHIVGKPMKDIIMNWWYSSGKK